LQPLCAGQPGGAALQLPKPLQRGVDPGVFREGTAPVVLQGDQPGGELAGEAFVEEYAGVIPKDLGHGGIGIPAEGRPDGLVHIVVDPFGISDRADGMRLQQAEDQSHVARTGTNGFAPLRQGKSGIPVCHRILAFLGVRDVRVKTNRVI
jgi:hypothetical protein